MKKSDQKIRVLENKIRQILKPLAEGKILNNFG